MMLIKNFCKASLLYLLVLLTILLFTGCDINEIETGINAAEELSGLVQDEKSLSLLFDNVTEEDNSGSDVASSGNEKEKIEEKPPEVYENADLVDNIDEDGKITEVTDNAAEEILYNNVNENTVGATTLEEEREVELSTAVVVNSNAEDKASEDSEYIGDENKITYVLNKNTKKFHFESCGSASQIKEANRGVSNDRNKIIAQGYAPCKRCNP